MYEDSKPIGGWLILVALGVVLRPLNIIATLFPMYSTIFFSGQWESFSIAGVMAYGRLYTPFIIAEFAINVFFLFFAIYLVYLLFRKSYKFPSYFIAYFIGMIIFILLDAMVGGMITEEAVFDSATISELFKTGIYAVVWIPYMKISQRVKETFVRR